MKKILLSFLIFLTSLFGGFGVFCFEAHQNFMKKTKEIDHMLTTLTKGFLKSDQFAQRLQLRLYSDLYYKFREWKQEKYGEDPVVICRQKLQPVWEQLNLNLNQTVDLCHDLVFPEKGISKTMRKIILNENEEFEKADLFLSNNTNFWHQNIDFFKRLYYFKHDFDMFTYLPDPTYNWTKFQKYRDQSAHLSEIFGQIDFINFHLLFLNLTDYQDLKLKNMFYHYSMKFIRTFTREVQKTFHFGHPSNFTLAQVLALYQKLDLFFDYNYKRISTTLNLFLNKTKEYGI